MDTFHPADEQMAFEFAPDAGKKWEVVNNVFYLRASIKTLVINRSKRG